MQKYELSQCINSILKINQYTNIPRNEGCNQIKKSKLKEIAEKRPHRSWELKYIQMFLDKLFICKRGFWLLDYLYYMNQQQEFLNFHKQVFQW
ncbi:unnamed protein product [Paramecium primaurelia]|uniref:Uncharacterized protein n=1 Tax=Paramecium primaurelia TaxID=5886 RepID=A0A8S1NW67_PARPR|nr:unnamed protein product [Paramecium primaurelia]